MKKLIVIDAYIYKNGSRVDHDMKPFAECKTPYLQCLLYICRQCPTIEARIDPDSERGPNFWTASCVRDGDSAELELGYGGSETAKLSMRRVQNGRFSYIVIESDMPKWGDFKKLVFHKKEGKVLLGLYDPNGTERRPKNFRMDYVDGMVAVVNDI